MCLTKNQMQMLFAISIAVVSRWRSLDANFTHSTKCKWRHSPLGVVGVGSGQALGDQTVASRIL